MTEPVSTGGQTTRNTLPAGWVYTPAAESTAVVASSSEFEPEALRCTFEIQKFAWETYWFGFITIYNFSPETENLVITQGMKVIVEAGYEDAYGKIFEGNVFQPMWDRENVVDFRTMLHCIDGLGIVDGSITNLTREAGYDYRALIAAMASDANIQIGGLMDMGADKFPRGRTLFGEPKQYLREIAQDKNAQYWLGDGQLNMGNIDDESQVDPNEALVITPQNGLIGTPQQTQQGVVFRTLLNPQIVIKKPPNLMMVKLDNTIIRQAKAQIGQMVTLLDQDGIYKVIGIRHFGDTRGNDWYTEVTAVNRAGKLSSLELLSRTQNG